MKSVVIGGAGFIGSHLTDALLNAGGQVIGIDNLSRGSKANIAHLSKGSGYQFIEMDAANMQELISVFMREKPDYVYQLAANSDIQASAQNPEIEYKNTYSTTFAALMAMRACGTKNLFFASTSAVYGDKRDEVLDENTSHLSPISYYGAAKLGSEALISAFSYMNDFSSLVFRFPNVIGPRLTHGVIFDFIHKLRDNPHQLSILGDGNQTKPYIYISDLIDAVEQFRIVPKGTTLYNLGVSGATSVTHIADIICEEMQLKDVVYYYTGSESGWKGDVPRFTYCLDKIHAAGWNARYTSDEAVRMTVKAVLGK